jgi:hypothetical protein
MPLRHNVFAMRLMSEMDKINWGEMFVYIVQSTRHEILNFGRQHLLLLT